MEILIKENYQLCEQMFFIVGNNYCYYEGSLNEIWLMDIFFMKMSILQDLLCLGEFKSNYFWKILIFG